ncbi:TetR/AcrR family transcriptional regulator C-terminal domain-containing protein [Microbacterium sp. YJN-G]|uniref:TetR/AcrR family transcriptional regulator C-terminal domain-containing protein n=1 Tax=Microbacterium sp. YJN-G TaxID=2763257 RepID=UPI001D0C7882|nr:hypothetical protein [Microbacterium sp. YJN-G]
MVVAGYAEQARTRGLSPDEISAEEAALFDRVVTGDEFPHLRRAVDAGVFTAPDDPFRFAIERLLDGVAMYIDALDRGEEHAAAHDWIGVEPAELSDDRKLREAQKAVRDAEKALRAARKAERQAHREAADRAARARP